MTKQRLGLFSLSFCCFFIAWAAPPIWHQASSPRHNSPQHRPDTTDPSGLNRLDGLSGLGSSKTVQESKSGLDADLPFDPEVRTGTLPNGMRYYLKRNAKPEKRLELRLAVNAGSMQEDDDQRGLAHFVEHMAFNGTRNFEKNDLISFLQLTGVRFGADLNAYTSFDETVYMLQLPTDKEGLVDKGLLVMSDWATGITFDGEEIDKERGVIESEWRTGLGANERMRQVYWPKIFYQSRYADRLPIGVMQVIRNAPYERFRTFYKDWYRPNLMALVVVGDIDLDEMETKVKEQFSQLENPPNPKPKEVFPVPNHKETLVAIAKDKEATGVDIQLIIKHPAKQIKTLDHYRDYLAQGLYAAMFNARLNELAQKSDAPFTSAFGQYGSFVRAKDAYYIGLTAKENSIEQAWRSLLTEQARVLQHGFTDTELERQKQNLLKRLQKRYDERDKTPSATLAMECVQHFLDEEPMFGIERELALAKEFIPKIRLEDVNKLAEQWYQAENRALLLTAPDKPNLNLPDEKTLLEWTTQGEKVQTEAYVDKVLDQPLLAQKPKGGTVTNKKHTQDQGLNIHEWTLSNGLKVIIKPTNFQNNQIRLYAFSPGGTSLVSEADYLSATLAADIVENAGIGAFDRIALQKKLAGQDLSLSPYISELYEGFSGRSSVEDLETLLQINYLYATQPREDAEAFEALMSQVREQMKNAAANPQQFFFDAYAKMMSKNSPRRRQLLDEEDLAKIKLDKAMRIYRDRFADFSDFTYVFVGNIDPEKHQALIETYLGSLPTKKRKENWKDLKIAAPKEGQTKALKKGLAPQSFVIMAHSQEQTWSPETSLRFSAAMDVLEIMVRDNLREDKGGVYSPYVGGGFERQPRDRYQAIVFFQCAPDNVDNLVAAVREEFNNLRNQGPSAENLAKVKETFRRTRETDLENNNFWLNTLVSYNQSKRPYLDLFKYNAMVDALTVEEVQKIAKELLDPNKLKVLSLSPEVDTDEKP